MYIESIKLSNFRCFDPAGTNILLQSDLTTFVGSNGSGKTAVMYALMRMFGVTSNQRKVCLQDYHIPIGEEERPAERTFWIEVCLVFPELAEEGVDIAVPAFFHQMASDDNGTLKVRLRLNATWTDDGSLEGDIDTQLFAISTFEENYDEDQTHNLSASDRSRIQFIYIPAVRSASAQVASFLSGRLWRAISWSDDIKDALDDIGATLNSKFSDEPPVSVIAEMVKKRWTEMHTGGTDTTPIFRPIDMRFQEFVRKIEVVFHPDEDGRERSLEDLSDGQSSLFHIAMATAALDMESKVLSKEIGCFEDDGIPLPSLTILALEEPENNLSPFYLSRIVEQVKDVTKGQNAQSLISSHSASILARVVPEQIRHFRLEAETRSSIVRSITLPDSDEEAGKYLREAVHAYPELYFAKFVILGEGASEEIILPRIAEAMNVPIDRSFVSIVPLGGRHVNHMWRLLNDLKIPHATLLDLDLGRHGGGWGRIKYVFKELLAIGKTPVQISGDPNTGLNADNYSASFDNWETLPNGEELLLQFMGQLRSQNVFFSHPIDIDWSMLNSFFSEYQTLEEGMSGPSDQGNPKIAVLGDQGNLNTFENEPVDKFKWYRYLFLGAGKPTTHLRILGKLSNLKLADNSPEELRNLISTMRSNVFPEQQLEKAD